MNYYRVDYFDKRINAYTYVTIKAKTVNQAMEKVIKRLKIDNIEYVTLIAVEK